MLVKENIEIGGKAFVKTYSDTGFYIERDGARYSEAIDPADILRTYIETDEPIESEADDFAYQQRAYTETNIPIDIEPSPIDEDIVQKAEAFDYLTGRSGENE